MLFALILGGESAQWARFWADHLMEGQMRIAFTHNLQLTRSEEEASFDRPETVDAITRALEHMGHEVERIEVSGPASRIMARLEALAPDLIFNTAEGREGRWREAFYPGLFEQLGFPYTGSDAYTCTLTLDKQLTKMVLVDQGIPTPRWYFITDINRFAPPRLRFPVIVKPNFESGSKGITQDSVIEHPGDLYDAVKRMLERYPAGILVEEFIEGRDVNVPFLEKGSPKTGGVLPAFEYEFSPEVVSGNKYNIYDYMLNHFFYEHVGVKSPADLSAEQAKELQRFSRKIYDTLGLRDLGRIDYRITPDGRIYFLEVNALPSLEPGAGILASGAQVGLKDLEAVLKTILTSAGARQGVDLTKHKARAKKTYRVGLTYNLKRKVPKQAEDDDSEAEFDAEHTVDAIADAIASYGHEVVKLEATQELPSIIASSGLDMVFNIAEGIHGRSRESQVPAICDLLDIPYTGSDPATLSITLDKALAKRIVVQAGIPTPKFIVLRTGLERLPKSMRYPLILKPNAEGSSKGVMGVNVVENERSLRERAADLIGKYKQSVLVEEFLSGREFTLGLLGDKRPKVLPPMEIIFNQPDTEFPIYAFEHKLKECGEVRYEAPAKVDAKLLKELQRVARGAFIALGCADVARIDVRLDARGRVYFIECNPLPGLTPGWSDLCLVAQAAGMDYRTLIGEVMAPTLRRLRERGKQGV